MKQEQHFWNDSMELYPTLHSFLHSFMKQGYTIDVVIPTFYLDTVSNYSTISYAIVIISKP